MAPEETATLRERAALIRANTISATSRRAYRATWSRLVAWLRRHKPELVNAQFASLVRVPSEPTETVGNPIEIVGDVRSTILAAIDADSKRAIPPIEFDQLNAGDFVEWLLTLQKRDGTAPGFNNHRAALFNLLREYRRVMIAELQSKMATHFRGLKRSVAEQTARGGVAVKIRKDPLSFELYEFLCTEMLKSASKDLVFARAILVITWNLMCRSSNTVGIARGHMEWRDDALCVYFAHMKNDQTGSRPRDPRHVYAKPLRPSICPVLALGVYWTVFAVDGDQLFPGAAQHDRFRKLLHSFLQQEDVKAELLRRGVVLSAKAQPRIVLRGRRHAPLPQQSIYELTGLSEVFKTLIYATKEREICMWAVRCQGCLPTASCLRHCHQGLSRLMNVFESASR